MRVSVQDVAKRANVSAMTVSNVLRHRSGCVSEATRLRVLQALKELNYIPVRSAAQNRHIETNVIGVVFLQDMQGYVGQQTFWGMSARARELDHDLLIVLRPQPEWMAADAAAPFLDRRCDGYVIIGGYQPALSAALAAHQVPVVECYSVSPPPGVARVVSDDQGAVRQALEWLWEMGHRRIAHLGGPAGDSEADLRADTFRAVMLAKGAAPSPQEVVRSIHWGGGHNPKPRIDSFVRAARAAGITAVVCASDALALDLWRAVAEIGLDVPRDLSITGMDDTQGAQAMGLASTAVSFEQVGRAAVDALLSLTKGTAPEEAGAVVPSSLIKRASVAPVRAIL